MNKSMYFLLLGILVATPAVHATESDFPVTVVMKTPITSFDPFKIEELRDPVTKLPYAPDAQIELKADDDRVLFKGTPKELLKLLNETEEYYNKLGYSLRSENIIEAFKGLVDPDQMNGQLANTLGIDFASIKDRIKPALKECRTLDVSQLGINARTRLPFKGRDEVELNLDVTFNAEQFVDRINEQQKLLCSAGLSMLEDVERWSDDTISFLMKKRTEAMEWLGVSKYHKAFDMQLVQKIRSYEEAAQEILKAAKSGETPDVERIYKLAQEAVAKNDPDLKLPDLPEIPNIPSPVLERRLDLKLRKRKEWPGINLGSRNTLGIYSNAWLEVRGSESEQEVSAVGTAGAYVLKNDLNVLYGHAQLTALKEKVSGTLRFRFMGRDLIDKRFEEQVFYQYGDPRAFSSGLDVSYEQQFVIGIVPVYVKVGARGDVYLGWQVAVRALQIEGNVFAGADFSAYADAAVGISGFLSVGAGGNVHLLDARLGLHGDTSLRFDPTGVPYLAFTIDAGHHYSALHGSIYAFAEYPVPRFGLPPWKTKRSNFDIFSWHGFSADGKIMNWSMELSPFRAKMSGDLIDQSDRAELQYLQDIRKLADRKVALGNLEHQVAQKEVDLFNALKSDLESDVDREIPVETSALAHWNQQIKNAHKDVLEEIKGL